MKKILLLLSVLLTCWQINAQYCTTVIPTGCAAFNDTIDDFTISAAGFNHSATGCSANNYGDFTADATLQIDLAQATPYDFTITHGAGGQWVKIWIDFNLDQVFDASEVVFASTAGGAPTVGSFTIPTSATIGLTRMRVITIFGQEPSDPCTPMGTWGETHDYTVNILPPPSCPAPTNLVSVSVANTTADFAWDDVPSATAGYLWEVYNAGDDPAVDAAVANGTFPVASTSGQATGLSASSDYDFYLTADCGAVDGQSTTIGPISFSTLCDVIVAPYTQDFNTNPSTIPNCWEQGSGNLENWLFTDTPTGHIGNVGSFSNASASGGGFAWVDDSAAHNIDTRLESPLIDVSGLTVPALSFYFVSNNEGETNVDFRVEVWDGAAWNQVFFSNQNSLNGEWEEIILDLSALTITGDIQLAFIVDENNGTDFDDDLAIDDVSVIEAPACLKPANFAVVDVFFDSIEVSWDAVSNATSGYVWEVYAAGDDPAVDTPVSTGTFPAGSTQGIADGLMPEMDYDIYLASDCGATDGISEFTNAIVFTTTPLCNVPSTFEVINVLPDSAELTWSGIPNATGYNWAVFNAGDDPASATPVSSGIAPSTDTSVVVTGLTDNTSYDAYITTDCGTDGLSAQSSALTFLTPCVALVAPVTEDFDGSDWATGTGFGNTGDSIDDCWQRTPSSPSFFWGTRTATTGSTGTGPSGANSGSNYMFTEGSNGNAGDEAFLVSPLIDLSPLSNPSLTFWYHMFGADMGTLSVDVDAGAGYDLDVFTISGQQQSASADPFIEQIVDLAAYSGQTVRIRFRGVLGSGFASDMAIDDVLVDEAPSCFTPIGLAVANVTQDSADLSWNDNSTATDGFNWLVFNAGDDPDVDTPVASGSVAAGITTVNVTGLPSSTPLQAYVQSNCGSTNGLSDLSSSVSFDTLCDVFPTPYFEDFQNFAVTTAFVEDGCWTETSSTAFAWDVSTGGTPSTTTGPSGAQFGDNYIFTEASSGAQGDEAIVLGPLVDLSTLTDPSLSFWYHMYGADMDVLHVDVISGGNTDMSVFSITGQQQSASDEPWLEELVDLSAYAGQTIQVQFRVVRGGGFNGDVGIDGVRFDEIPVCFVPTNLAVSNITETTADFSWDDEATATDGYNWYVFEAGDDPDFDTAVASGSVASGVTTVNVTGLPSSSALQFYVESDCGANGFSLLSVAQNFDTLCDIFPTPYFEDFANFAVTTSFVEDGCWEEVSPGAFAWDVGTGATGSTNTGPSGAEFGSNYIFTEASSGAQGDEAIVLSPEVDLSNLTEPSLSFWYHMYGSDMGTLHVDVDDGTNLDLSIFSISGQQQAGSGDAWVEQFVDLSPYAGQTIQVRFRVERGDGFEGDLSLDGVRFDEAPSCFTPTGLSVVNVGNDSVTISWDDLPGASDGYEIFIFEDGDDPATDTPFTTVTEPSGVNSTTVTGLVGLTTYQAYILADCGATDGQSNLSSDITFTTLCDPFVAPYVEDFNANGTSIPDCWEQAGADNKSWLFTNPPTFSHVGDNGTLGGSTSSDGGLAWVDDSAPHVLDTRLHSPLIDVSSLSVPFLSFYLISNNEGETNVDFRVEVWDGAAWNEVFFSNSNTLNGEWEEIQVELSSLTFTGNAQIAFIVDENNGTDFYDDVAIDDVRLEEAPTCPKPGNVAIIDVFFDSLEVSWNPISNATNGYIWEVYEAGDDPTTDAPVSTGTFPAGTTTGIADGLAPETDYDFYMASDCGATDGQSVLTNPLTFTTTELCSLPSTFEVTNVLPDSVELSWSAVPNAVNGYLWAVFNAGDDPDTDTPVASGTAASGDTSVVATGLTDNSDYEAYITTDCGSTDGQSDQSQALAFSTPCSIFVAPYFNDFEAFPVTTTLEEEDCWIEDSPGAFGWDVSTGGTGSLNTGPSGALSGNNYVFTEATSGSQGDEAILLSPLVDLSALAQPALSFWYHMYGADTGTLAVDVKISSSSNFDLDVFTLSGQQQTAETDAWIEQFVDLSSYSGETIQFRFRVVRGDGFTGDVGIEDVLIDEAPSCLTPTGLAISNETANSVDISWSAVGNATAGYNWLVFAAGADPDVDTPFLTGSVAAGVTTATITGLNPATVYDVYIQSDCGSTDGQSNLSPSVTFQTLCATLPAPYFNDFENFTPTTTFVEQECFTEVSAGAFDWNVTDTDTPSNFSTGPNQAFSGVNFFYTEGSSGALGDEALLESPSIDLSPLSVPSLSFWYHMFGDDMGNLYVDVDAGSGYDLAVFTLTGQQQVNQTDDWIQQFVDLSAYAGQSVVIRLRGERGDGFSSDISIDDFRVDEAPTCFDPNNLEVLSVTDTTAELSWTAGSSETIFDIEVVTAGTSPTGVPTHEDVTVPFTVTGLTAETEYDFYVRADCGAGDVSNWVGPVSFTTVFTPTTVVVNDPAINNTYCYGNDEVKEWLFVSSDGVTPVELQFSAGEIENDPDSSDRCRIFDGFDINAPVLYDTDIDGTDMTGVQLVANSGAAYIYLESDNFGSCQGGIVPLVALDFDVFAGTVSAEQFSAQNFNFYPNPVRSILNIESANPISSIQVYDMLGKVVYDKNFDASNLDINLQELSSGTYLMKVNIGNFYETFRIIKE